MSINEPFENEENISLNRTLDASYDTKLKVWNKYVAANEKNKKTPFPKDPLHPNKQMRRAPHRSKFKSQLFQCMCSTSKCVTRNSDTCSTCPLKMEKAKENPNKESQLEDRQNIGGQS